MTAIYEDYILKSDECKSKENCGDSDWWFDEENQTFNRYYTFHHELYGTQTEHEQILGQLLTDNNSRIIVKMN